MSEWLNKLNGEALGARFKVPGSEFKALRRTPVQGFRFNVQSFVRKQTSQPSPLRGKHTPHPDAGGLRVAGNLAGSKYRAAMFPPVRARAELRSKPRVNSFSSLRRWYAALDGAALMISVGDEVTSL